MTDFAFDRARHDRAAHRRAEEPWRDPATRVLAISGEQVATVDGPAIRWLTPGDAPEGEWIWLGEQHGVPHAAVVVDALPDDLAPTGLRMLAPLLPADDLSLAVHAAAMERWLTATPFCPRCGGRTRVEQGGHLRVCDECGSQHFPRTDPAVIMLVTDDRDRALLGSQRSWGPGRFSLLAGFVEPGEALEDAVRREVREESGVVVGDVRYAASQPWPFPASLMLGFFASATSTAVDVTDDELAEARWFSREELAAALADGSVTLPPPGVSISRWLLDRWYQSDS